MLIIYMSKRECVQCFATTKQGARCKKRTCIYSKFCNIHTKQLFNLYLKKSAIPNSGMGLITAKVIESKKRIAQYTGDILRADELPSNPTGYSVAIPHNKVIDASSTQSGIARYANDCRSSNKAQGHCKGSNAKFSVSTRKGVTSVWIVSTKRIPANTEIFVSYGRGYWNK